jgi:hypothetical protein
VIKSEQLHVLGYNVRPLPTKRGAFYQMIRIQIRCRVSPLSTGVACRRLFGEVFIGKPKDFA